MKRKNKDKEQLSFLFRQTCPEPKHADDFTGRVMRHIAKERRRQEEAVEYWRMVSGHSYGTSWRGRLIDALLSPVLIIVVAVAVCVSVMALYSKEVTAALASLFMHIEGIVGPVPYILPAVLCLSMTLLLCLAIAMIHNEE
ncbi:hypothetical protein [Xylanibacter muris]|uniref:Uncharacterized protein n=1 Tax=Xylanibacter muris TaxID=2736290 RepID=A0ABX2AMV5_9BACT|nr:hypothetical protein [Xylanibacter muris]NPD92566.1 hypothetical protein [Xylanibacter muris]